MLALEIVLVAFGCEKTSIESAIEGVVVKRVVREEVVAVAERMLMNTKTRHFISDSSKLRELAGCLLEV